jgi:aspartyl-tRNA(Asn)/glutamyl-tRNA(Gln) amidotransferase subunit B
MSELKGSLPELPAAKRSRYRNEYGIKDEDIEIFINDETFSTLFEITAKKLENKEKIKLASNYITSDLRSLEKDGATIGFSPDSFVELINMVGDAVISSRAAKDILARIFTKDESPMEIAKREDLIQKNDEGALKEIVQKVIDANPQVVTTYKGGKENALMSLVGQIMKETKGSANPGLVQKLLKELIG